MLSGTGRPIAREAVRRGISLVEVMLALTIMLLALSAIGSLVAIGSDNGMSARLYARGNRLAQAKMAEVEAGVIPVQSGASGTFDDETDWSWTIDPQPQGLPNLYQVTVKVSRDIRGKPFEISLTQMLFDPQMMGSAAQAEQPSTDDVNAASATSGTGGTGGMSP